jgi:phenylalanyl-tRNA synthetase alpha chain
VDALPELLYTAQAAIAGAGDLCLLDQVRVHYLGKKGVLTERLKELGKLPPEERRQAGQAINEAKQGWKRRSPPARSHWKQRRWMPDW